MPEDVFIKQDEWNGQIQALFFSFSDKNKSYFFYN